MQSSCSKLLGIYKDVYSLMICKRRLFEQLSFSHLPSSQLKDQKSMSSKKIFNCLKKIISQIKTQLSDLANHGKFEDQLTSICRILTKLKSSNNFSTQQEKLLAQAGKLILDWRQENDPLIYYEQGSRTELYEKLINQIIGINKALTVAKETRKPLYILKLQQDLRDNLDIFSQQQRKYNKFQEAVGDSSRKKLSKLVSKLLDSINNTSRNQLVKEEKNDLFAKYFDIFNDSSKVKEKDILSYHKDLQKAIKNIATVFLEQKKGYLLLMDYLRDLAIKVKSVINNINFKEDEISKLTCNISQDIKSVICFEEALQIFTDAKDLISLYEIINILNQKVSRLDVIIEEGICMVTDFNGKLKLRDSNRQNPILYFIEDNKFLDALIEKQSVFQNSLYEFFTLFIKSYFQRINSNDNKERKSQEACKLKIEKVFQKLFTKYFDSTEALDQMDYVKCGPQSQLTITLPPKDIYSQKKLEIQTFLKELAVYEQNKNWDDSYQCSLGPKLLIHGKMKILPEGIYYESNFNKKNIFFGKTKLFIPKEDIYEINKQSAFVIFADVVEVVTKKGPVYFHALGKREVMCKHLVDQFFPQINNPSLLLENIPFNSFNGSSPIEQNRIKPYLQKLEYQIACGQIPNIDLPTFFHKYESDLEFTYQGITYKDFKHYTISLTENSSIQSTNFTPGIPSYLKLAQSQLQINNLSEQLTQSERFFTYNKTVPTIPFSSRGIPRICRQKSVFHWGGPKCLVVDIYTTLQGFSLTEGMIIQSRKIYKQKNNVISYQISGSVTFQNNSPINSMLRRQALFSLKNFLSDLFEKIIKLQKNNKQISFNSIKKIEENQDEKGRQIQKLTKQNQDIRKLMKNSALTIIFAYLITMLFLMI